VRCDDGGCQAMANPGRVQTLARSECVWWPGLLTLSQPPYADTCVTEVHWFMNVTIVHVRQLQTLLTWQGTDPRMVAMCLAAWLFNPFTATISTRGNADALTTAILLQMLLFLYTGVFPPAEHTCVVAPCGRLSYVPYKCPLENLHMTPKCC
jgi:hypothetical protein